ncbi:MAG: hypothetical protein NC180_10625 [Muribaculaceae bacterium]|nr:hypothetical protein [Roseburia sp.]MCM1432134.1 hypothetical protein [Muribaculaceae bacterium]MCM1493666.1 hypothetical protein [Muribaculaceae bacterium]MCM1560219.1 hypothetical protein [Butyrivibrio sp.]
MINNFLCKILTLFKKSTVYELKEVFTPTSSANISYISRISVEKKLKKALDIPGKQIVIYGHSGSGKTTILNHIVKEQHLKTITSRCTNNSTIDTIILDAFDALNPYYTESTNVSHKESLSSSIASEYLGIKSSISGTLENSVGEVQKRVLPPQLTIQRLCDFIGSAKALWIIEDFHKIPENEKSKISQMMKLFMDKAVDYPNSKIIVLGAANNGYEVVQHDTELNNRVSEIEVPLLTTSEIVKIVEKGATALNISISNETATKIAKYANCLATIAHQLAYNLCYNNNIKKTQRKLVIIPNSELDPAVKDFTNEKQDTYKKLYMKITQQREGKYQNVSIILSTLCEMDDNVTQHALLTKIQENFPSYPPSNLSTYLKQLYSPEREEVLRNNAGRISFSEPFFKSYIRMLNIQQP